MLLDRRCGTSDVRVAYAAAQPRLALAFSDDAQRLDLAQHCPVLSLDGLVDVDPVDIAEVDPDAAAVVVFTSGTTSTPKGVIHTVNSLRCGTANMVDALQLSGADTLSLSSPLAGITGVLQVESALSVGGKVVLVQRFSAQTALNDVCTQGATVIGGAPVIAQTLFAEAIQQGVESLPLRCIALGGTMIPTSVIDDATRFGVRAVRVYGSSEVPFSTATALDVLSADDGEAMPGVEVAVGGSDELLISGPHRFHGYLDPAHNAGAFDGDWVRTGDQADILEGRRIRIKGRLKEVVARKGMKMSLAEIDAIASELGDCAAFSVPDDDTGERLALAIRGGEGFELSYSAVVERLVAAGLATWKLPEQIVLWIGDFPRTESGKIIRHELADSSRHQRTVYAPRLSRH